MPAFLQPTAEQLAQLPSFPRSLAAAPDPHNAEAYLPFQSSEQPLLPPADDEGPGLTPEMWADYIQWVKEEEARLASA